MKRASRRWSYFKIKYFFIAIIIFWAINILFFQRAPGAAVQEINETFEQIMAIGITSTLRPDAQERRDAVRATWLRLVSNNKIKGVFVIGKPDCLLNKEECSVSTQSLLKSLEEEMNEYKDILFIDSTDSYSGLAKKTFAFHCWAYDHFPNLMYSMKTDDDIFVRIDTIVKELKDMPKTALYWGFTWKKAPKVDLKTHKNYEANYEPPEYPSFNSGVGNILSADLVKYIANNRNLLRPLSNEDVTIGTWLSTLNVHTTHDTRFQAHPAMCFEEMITKHPVKPPEMKMFYDRVINRVKLCTEVESYACPYGRVCTEGQSDWAQGLACDENGCEPHARREASSPADALRAQQLLASSSIFCSLPSSRDPRHPPPVASPFLPGNLVGNPGFDDANELGLYMWEKFYEGYTVDSDASSARAESKLKQKSSRLRLQSYDANDNNAYGVTQMIRIGQKLATPLMLMGWAKCEGRQQGNEALPQDVSIFMHVTFEDDTRDLQVTLEIAESSEWQFYSKLYFPVKAVKELSVSLILSRNKGTVWFDDVQLLSLESTESLCAATYVTRSLPEITLPTQVVFEGDKLTSISNNPLSCNANGPKFILVWTTNEDTFKLQHFRVVESIFFHHPDACIRIFTNTLNFNFFSTLAFSGYDTRVVRYDLRQIATKMPGEEWLNNIDKWKASPHFYAHSSDYLRFMLLYKFGGIYSDFDSIMVQPLPLPTLSSNFIGVEWCEAEGLQWCIDIDNSKFAIPKKLPKNPPPTTTFSFSIGLMGFDLGSSFVKEILERFVTDYTPTRWGCGTVLASMAYKQNPQNANVNIIPPHGFYPIGYQDIPKYFSENDIKLWNEIKENSYALHLFGKVSGKEEVSQGSLVQKALSEFAISNV